MGRPKPLGPRSSLAAALGAKVRKLRRQKGWSQRELGDRVYISAARVAQIELATDPPNEALTQDLDRVLEADDELNVAWWHMHHERHPAWARPYMELEERATRLRHFAPQLVPGLLQTPEYARALLLAGLPDASEAELERLVQARIARQRLLTRKEPLDLWVVLDETVLLRPFGGPALMRAQFEHLLAMGDLPNVDLQVLPLSAGHHGLMDAPLLLLGFADGPDAAYLSGLGSGEIVESPHTVNRFTKTYARLMVKSLSLADSRDLISAKLKELPSCPPPPEAP